ALAVLATLPDLAGPAQFWRASTSTPASPWPPAPDYPPRMPFYQRLGDVPRKRHVQHRENGLLLTEEVFGLEGFSGNESILYHLTSPCRVREIAEFEPIRRDEWVPETHAHR